MSERIRGRQCGPIAEALDSVPGRLRHLVGCDFFCGDALFAGLCTPLGSAETHWPTGRSYRTTEHVLYPHHARDRRLTVVLPKDTTPEVVLHELGHVLHWTLFERAGSWDAIPDLEPVSSYARLNFYETFAEAFLGSFYTPRSLDEGGYWLGYSRVNDEFFDRLGCR